MRHYRNNLLYATITNLGRYYGTLRKPENFVLERYDIANASVMPPLVYNSGKYGFPSYRNVK